MKRLIIVCEGPTEKEFCKDVLNDFFLPKGITLETPLIKHSGGGVVPWSIIKKQLENHLREQNAFVTLFLDYYGIKDDFYFPGWKEAKTIVNHEKKIDYLEQSMLLDLPENLRYRFIPHLQLHEFETLLFSDISAFANYFLSDNLNMEMLKAIVAEFPNPEDINNSPLTAPSKRLAKAVKGYKKVLDGNCIAMDIGLAKIRSLCPHFNKWIERLSQI